MVIWEKLFSNFYKISWWRNSAIPFGYSKLLQILTQTYHTIYRDPIKISEQDWDNLIILDGCRYDMFKEIYPDTDGLCYRFSPGASTSDFLTANFVGDNLHDTVYVTANPMYKTLDLDSVFFDIVDVWESDWDHELHTVRPRPMAEATIRANNRFPNKRIISHFLQPHYPFIGELGSQLPDHAGTEYTYRKVKGENADRENPTVWNLLNQEEISEGAAWDAYVENLEIAIPHIMSVIEESYGKTIVTSDHGNMVGEKPFGVMKPVYGHPDGVYTEELCKVPWLELPFEHRKETFAEDPKINKAQRSGKVESRLADLGYVDL